MLIKLLSETLRGRPGHNRFHLQPTRQRPVHPTGGTEAAGDEGITDRRIARLQQELGLKAQGDVFGELLRSKDEGVAEFLDLERVKPNTLGNSRMLLHL